MTIIIEKPSRLENARLHQLSPLDGVSTPTTASRTIVPVPERELVKLHPRGCRCTYHNPNGPWNVPRKVPPNSGVLPAGPRVILWDVECWQGAPEVDATRVANDYRFTRMVLGVASDDFQVFGIAHRNARRCSFALPLSRGALVLGSGKDGADKALDAAINWTAIAGRFNTFVVVSGDHHFIDTGVAAKALGMTTWLVTSDQAGVARDTKAAFDGHTHLKLSAVHAAVDDLSGGPTTHLPRAH